MFIFSSQNRLYNNSYLIKRILVKRTFSHLLKIVSVDVQLLQVCIQFVVSRGGEREGGKWKRRQSVTTSQVSTGEIIIKTLREMEMGEMEQLAVVFTGKGGIFRVSKLMLG
jgi:hypothetical protein